jgi:hypothetical protein
MNVDNEKVLFLRGLLVAFASNGQIVNYDDVRRLCRLNDEQMGTYLNHARKGLAENEPDFCAIVVKTKGKPGEGWGDPAAWVEQVQKSHRFWSDRRKLDNGEFEERYGKLPAIPGTSQSKAQAG